MDMRIGSNGKDPLSPLCSERDGDGRLRYYFARPDTFSLPRPPSSSISSSSSFHLVDLQAKRDPLHELSTFLKSWLLPEGYPDTVAPSYKQYMCWRALQYFFGGAMGVFTTHSLLRAVGASDRGVASSVVAINWVIKDGAGRVGKMLSARHGKRFDSDLKQLRFAGNLLMEIGAIVELSTIRAPFLFLPLACAANITKNVAAVVSTSTRAPIYKAMAIKENIGDVTAKGECISNIADLLGTGLGIIISRNNPSLFATFTLLSCGYIFSSYQEVKSVTLSNLNRARFGVAAHLFLETGKVPSILTGNHKEYVMLAPWARDKPIEIGSRVKDSFENPGLFLAVNALFERENYLITYHARKRQACVILRQKAKSNDILQAAFHAHFLLHILSQRQAEKKSNKTDAFVRKEFLSFGETCIGGLKEEDILAALSESCRHAAQLFGSFRGQAEAQGWIIGESYLNPETVRLGARMP